MMPNSRRRRSPYRTNRFWNGMFLFTALNVPTDSESQGRRPWRRYSPEAPDIALLINSRSAALYLIFK